MIMNCIICVDRCRCWCGGVVLDFDWIIGGSLMGVVSLVWCVNYEGSLIVSSWI